MGCDHGLTYLQKQTAALLSVCVLYGMMHGNLIAHAFISQSATYYCYK